MLPLQIIHTARAGLAEPCGLSHVGCAACFCTGAGCAVWAVLRGLCCVFPYRGVAVLCCALLCQVVRGWGAAALRGVLPRRAAGLCQLSKH